MAHTSLLQVMVAAHIALNCLVNCLVATYRSAKAGHKHHYIMTVVLVCLLDLAWEICCNKLHAMHCCCEAFVPWRMCSPSQAGEATHMAVVTQFLGFLC